MNDLAGLRDEIGAIRSVQEGVSYLLTLGEITAANMDPEWVSIDIDPPAGSERNKVWGHAANVYSTVASYMKVGDEEGAVEACRQAFTFNLAPGERASQDTSDLLFLTLTIAAEATAKAVRNQASKGY